MSDEAKAVVTKTRKKRQATPNLECPYFVDLRTPHTTESSGHLAELCGEFSKAYDAWHSTVRQHFADGGARKDVPVFDPKNFADPNKGAMTQKQYATLVDEWNAGDNKVQFPPRYNPALVELAHLMNARSLRRGAVKKHPRAPKSWDETELGSWMEMDEDGNNTIPSGYFFDDALPRRCHAKRAEDLVTDPELNIFTIGNNRYVVGDGTGVRSAAFLVWATDRGNYRAGDDARKRLSLAGNKDIVDLVFRIEDRANNNGGVTVKATWKENIREVVFLPGQALTAGFLFDGENRLTASEIRKLDANAKGIKFKTVRQVLDGPIVGKLVSRENLWTEIQSIEGSGGIKKLRERGGRSEDEQRNTPQNKSITNLLVTCRVDPIEAYPFGFRAAQCDMVPYVVHSVDDDFAMGIVIGDRQNQEHNIGVRQAKANAQPEEAEEDVAVEGSTPATETAKPKKSRKVKSTPKTTEKKASKPKRTKKATKAVAVETTEEAPVVEEETDVSEPAFVEMAESDSEAESVEETDAVVS